MKRKAVLAFLMSVVVASQSSMVAFAQEGVGTSDSGQITVSSVVMQEDSSVGVNADGEGNSVTVEGDVTTTGDYSEGVQAWNGGGVNVSGNITTTGKNSSAVEIWGENSQVTVGGDITASGAGSNGVSMNGDGSQITVGGNITVTGEPDDTSCADSYGILADSNSQAVVGGNVSSKNSLAIQTFDGASVTVKGDVSSAGDSCSTVSAQNESSVTVWGNVYSEGDGGRGVSTAGGGDGKKGAVVDIKGDVIVTGDLLYNYEIDYPMDAEGVNAGGASIVNIDGNVSSAKGLAVSATSEATVNIGGNVAAGENDYFNCPGVRADNNAKVNVSGNVTGGVDTENSATVRVGGDVFGVKGTGVRAVGGSTVIVEGTVNGTSWADGIGAYGISTQSGCTVSADKVTVSSDAGGIGVYIGVYESDQKGMVVVKNVAGGSNAIAVMVAPTYQGGNYNGGQNELFNPKTVEDLRNALPEMIFGELQADEDGEYVKWALSKDTTVEQYYSYVNTVLQNINYMVDVQNVNNGKISVSGLQKVSGYDVAKAGSTLVVTVTPDDGYEVTSLSGGKATVVKNDDGTYSVTVLDGGGINISAVISAIKVANAVAQEQDSASQNVMTQAEVIKAEEAIPVTVFASETAVNAIPAEAKEVVAEDSTTTYNLSSVKTMQGFVAAVNKIAKADPVASTVAVYSEKPVTLDVAALNSIEEMDKDFVYMFTYKGHLYKVIIPAGTKVDLRGAKSAGPLFIGAVLGTTEILK